MNDKLVLDDIFKAFERKETELDDPDILRGEGSTKGDSVVNAARGGRDDGNRNTARNSPPRPRQSMQYLSIT